MKLEVSAFMDGAADDSAAQSAISALKNEASLRQTWDTYHLIGDVLRQSPLTSPQFASRLMAQLASEPTVVVPVPRRVSPASRLMVPLAASLMGVGAVAWVAQSLDSAQPARPAVASLADRAPVQTVPAAVPVQVSDQPVQVIEVLPHSAPYVREYLLVHQGYSPRTNMQGVAPYLRSVSEQRQGTSK